jgi:predicted RNA-binding protein with PIN domain
MFYLIDGYNLALSVRLAKSLGGPGNTERARTRLLGWLTSRLDEVERSRTTVVFDSKDYVGDEKELRVSGMHVRFAVGYPDADGLIEELIARHSSPKQLVVISSDQRILSAAQARRSTGVKSHDWFDQLEARNRHADRRPEPDEKPAVKDPEKLVSEFDTAEIRQLIQDEIQPLQRPKPRRRPRST